MSLLNYGGFLNELNLSKVLTDSQIAQRKKLLKDNLQSIINICNKHNVRYWLDGGSLLGLYRDRDFIPGDTDNDLGIFVEDITEDFLDELGKNGEFNQNSSFLKASELKKLLQTDTYTKMKCLKYTTLNPSGTPTKIEDYIWTDVMLYYPDEDNYVYHIGVTYYTIPKKLLSSFKKMTRGGFTYNIPENIEKYLEHLYGKGWSSPDPNYKAYQDPDRQGVFANTNKEYEKSGIYKWNYMKGTSKKEKK